MNLAGICGTREAKKTRMRWALCRILADHVDDGERGFLLEEIANARKERECVDTNECP
jgi:hypothetical protein